MTYMVTCKSAALAGILRSGYSPPKLYTHAAFTYARAGDAGNLIPLTSSEPPCFRISQSMNYIIWNSPQTSHPCSQRLPSLVFQPTRLHCPTAVAVYAHIRGPQFEGEPCVSCAHTPTGSSADPLCTFAGTVRCGSTDASFANRTRRTVLFTTF